MAVVTGSDTAAGSAAGFSSASATAAGARGATGVSTEATTGAGRWLAANPLIFAFACGLGVALCGLVGNNAVFGTGYEEARAIIHGSSDVSTSFGPLKFLASLISAISGIPGGIFAPSLAIGAGLGQDLSLIFQHVPVAALALIGMVSYLTAWCRRRSRLL